MKGSTVFLTMVIASTAALLCSAAAVAIGAGKTERKNTSPPQSLITGSGARLDSSFSGDGIVTTDLAPKEDGAFAVAVQANGKIVAGGSLRFGKKWAIARYNTDGSLDSTFGGDGKVTLDVTPGADAVFGVAIQPDAKIVVAGDAGFDRPRARFAIARYNADGTLDDSFSGDGIAFANFTPLIDSVSDMVIQPNGKIVVSGGSGLWDHPKFALARFDTDGTLDSSFGGDGKVMTDVTTGLDFANNLVLQSDGKIVLGGVGKDSRRFALVRYNGDGTLDETFGGDGKVTTNVTDGLEDAQGVDIQADGKVVACGWGADGRKFVAARYNGAGTLDATFAGDGTVTTNITPRDDRGFDSEVDSNGRIVVAGFAGGDGSHGRLALVRYAADGMLDTTFGGDGRITTNLTPYWDFVHAVDIQADGNIVVAGFAGAGGRNAKFALARYLGS